jgi:hypothetical protein
VTNPQISGLPPLHLLRSSHLEVGLLTRNGLRISWLGRPGGRNLLAELPDLQEHTAHGPYRFWGGHRLWLSPEAFPRSYMPEDGPVSIAEEEGWVELTLAADPRVGVERRMCLRLDPEAPALELRSELHNLGAWAVDVGIWSITQLPLEGLVLMPLEGRDEGPLLPDRHLVLWPYTRLSDPRLRLHDDHVEVLAQQGQPLKVGTWSRGAWIEWRGPERLRRRAISIEGEGGQYPDRGCNIECYVNHRFIEMELLGPLGRLEPGQGRSFTERWELLPAGPS